MDLAGSLPSIIYSSGKFISVCSYLLEKQTNSTTIIFRYSEERFSESRNYIIGFG